MITKKTTLETVFYQAVCTETAEPLEPITCSCGTVSALDGQRLRYGTFFGQVVVENCACDAASKFGNVVWASRHQVAAFLHGMTDALSEDRERLLAVLPTPIESPNGDNKDIIVLAP